MISGPTFDKRRIRTHYDLATPFYRLFWGRHIHHGFWEGSESPAVAQQKLTDRVISEAGFRGGERVLDVGCGIGASAIYLAKAFGCDVTGVTLSPVQARWATLAARWHGVGRQTRFLAADAETVELPAESFDVVWILECTENLFDKPAFIRRVAEWLRPGGRTAICAWQLGDGPLDDEARRLALEVCEEFYYPSLGNTDDYRTWFIDAGLTVERSLNWTDRVAKTWELSLESVDRSHVHLFARLIGRKELPFWDRYRAILRAYRTGAMTYTCWIASKPD